MYRSIQQKPGVMLALGLAVGVVAGVLLPHSPVHAVATDRHENFAICTIEVESSLEAICVLDSVTGDLKAYVISPQNAKFSLAYHRNLVADFGLAGGGGANPKFLMVSGKARMNPRGTQFGLQAALYVTEITSGQIKAYGFPFNANMPRGGQNQIGLIDSVVFRQKLVRPGGASRKAKKTR